MADVLESTDRILRPFDMAAHQTSQGLARAKGLPGAQQKPRRVDNASASLGQPIKTAATPVGDRRC
jgi:hypothetical protein